MNTNVDVNDIVQNLYEKIKNSEDKGSLASYIPELENVNSQLLGRVLTIVVNLNFVIRNCNDQYSLYIRVYVLSRIVSSELIEEDLWTRIKMQQSGTSS